MMQRVFDTNFLSNKIRYIIQSSFAGIAVAVALMLFDVVHHPVLIASFGSSAFLAFALPHNELSRTRYLVGGYFVGILTGCLVHYVLIRIQPGQIDQKLLYVAACGTAVWLAVLLMAVTNTEHAPGTSIALSIVISKWTVETLVLIMVGIIIISCIKKVLKKWMINLI